MKVSVRLQVVTGASDEPLILTAIFLTTVYAQKRIGPVKDAWYVNTPAQTQKTIKR